MTISTGTRKSRSVQSRANESLVEIDKNFIQSLKLFAESTNDVAGLAGGAINNSPKTPAGNYLAREGDSMIGPIAFGPPPDFSIEVDANETIDIGPLNENPQYSSNLQLDDLQPNGSVLDVIANAAFDGQILILRTFAPTVPYIISQGTLANGGNIQTLDGNDLTMGDLQTIYLAFDEALIIGENTGGTWRVVTTGSAGSGNVPPGTAQFQHLEWDGSSWIPQQTLAFGASHANTGQLQFINDQIGLAWRNSAGNGNLEMKVTDSNTFDFTYDQEFSLALQIRAQHDSDADNILALAMGTGSGAVALIETSTANLNIAAGGTTRLRLDADPITQLDLVSPTGQALFNIIADDTGTPNILGLTIGVGASSPALIESSTALLNIAAGGASRLFLDTTSVTKLNLKVPDVATSSADFNIISNDTVTGNESLGLAMGSGTSAIALIESSTAFLNIGAGGVSRLFLDVSSITKLNLESPDNVTATANFNIISKHVVQADNILGLTIGSGTNAVGLIDNSTDDLFIATSGISRLSISDTGLIMLGASNIALGNNNITGVNQLAFNEAGQTITDGAGGLTYSIPDTLDTHDFMIDSNTPVSIEKFFLNLSNTRIQMTQEIDPSAPDAGDIFVYSKESSSIAKLFYRQSDGVIVGPLGAGGGGAGPPFSDATPLVFDNNDNTRLFQIEAGGVLSGTTSILGTVTLNAGRSWSLPDASTTIAGLAVQQTFTNFNTFTSTASFTNAGNAIAVAGDIQMTGQNIIELTDITFNTGGSLESDVTGIDIKTGNQNKEIILNVGSLAEFLVARDSSTGFCQISSPTEGIGPELRLFNSDFSISNGDIVGAINFNAENSSGFLSLYGRIQVTAEDKTSSNMDSRMSFGIKSASSSTGQVTEVIIIEGGPSSVPKIGFRGTLPQPVQTIFGDADGALASLLSALNGMGLIIDATTSP